MVLKKKSAVVVGLIQALGLAGYCSLVGILFWKGNSWFGKLNNLFGSLLFLSLFVVSVLICGLIVFGYPLILFWDKKQTKEALKIVLTTTGWFLLSVIIYLIVLAI